MGTPFRPSAEFHEVVNRLFGIVGDDSGPETGPNDDPEMRPKQPRPGI